VLTSKILLMFAHFGLIFHACGLFATKSFVEHLVAYSFDFICV
jgi:hypothetical protein